MALNLFDRVVDLLLLARQYRCGASRLECADGGLHPADYSGHLGKHCAESGGPGFQARSCLGHLSPDLPYIDEVLAPAAGDDFCEGALPVIKQSAGGDLPVLRGSNELGRQLRHLDRAPHQIRRLKAVLPIILKDLGRVRRCRLRSHGSG